MAWGGIGYSISKAFTERTDRFKDLYVAVSLGEYGQKHKLIIMGEKISEIGKWHQYKDLQFFVEGKKLQGDDMFFTKLGGSGSGEFCLGKKDNSSGSGHQWCWKRNTYLGNQDQYEGGWKLEELLFKFNFDSKSDLLKGNLKDQEYKMHVNKIGNRECSVDNLRKCVYGNKTFDVEGTGYMPAIKIT